jgi:hypothetical protein
MSVLTFYIIRHKPTGGFLPELTGVRAGYTHTEPQMYGVPRLFLDAAGAKRALAWWLKGTTRVWRGQDSFTGEYEEDWSTDPKEHRKAEDMEVVPVVLKL